MKYLIIAIALFAQGCSSSNGNSTSATGEYVAAVSFGSVCCGTVSDDFLKTFVKKYSSDHNVEIKADVAAACGKEGEFSVLFKNAGGNQDNAAFIKELQQLVSAVDAKNRASSTSSGTLELKQAVNASDFAYCRLGIKPWQ